MLNDLILRRWAPEILLGLDAGPKRFNWLLQDITGISDRILTERLRELEDAGLVERHVETTRPISVYYRLSVAGARYVGPLEQLRIISAEQHEEVASRAS